MGGDRRHGDFGFFTELIVYLNGEFLPLDQARISPEDRGFLLGDGVFDTLRTYHGKLFRFQAHAARLFHGLDEVRIEVAFDTESLQKILLELIRRNNRQDAVVRLTVTRGEGRGGYRIDPGTPATVYASIRDIPDVEALRRNGIELVVSPVPRPLPFQSVAGMSGSMVKTTSIGAMALARVLSNGHEALMLDAEGFIAEGAASTVYAVMAETIVTPPQGKVLPAITRAVIEESMRLEERKMTVDDLLAADAVFTSATSTGPIPVRRIGNQGPGPSPKIFPVDNAVFARVIESYDEAIEAYCRDHKIQ